MTSRLALALSGLLLIAAVAAPGAAARPSQVASSVVLESNARLAGGGVVFFRRGRRHRSLDLVLLRDGRPRVLRRIPPPERRGRRLIASLAGSQERIAYTLTETAYCGVCGDELDRARVVGTLTADGRGHRVLYSCGQVGGDCSDAFRGPSIGVRGELVAVAIPDGPEQQTITVYDFERASGMPRAVPLPGSDGSTFASGALFERRFLGLYEYRPAGERALSLYDWRRGAIRHRFTAPTDSSVDWDLQADGTVAVSYQSLRTGRNRIGWVGAGGGRLHLLQRLADPDAYDAVQDVRIARDRVASSYETGREDRDTRVRVVDLRDRVVLSLRVRGGGYLADFDGSCVLWTAWSRGPLANRRDVWVAAVGKSAKSAARDGSPESETAC